MGKPKFEIGDRVRNIENVGDTDLVWEGDVVDVYKQKICPCEDGYVYLTHGRWVEGMPEEFQEEGLTSRPIGSEDTELIND